MPARQESLARACPGHPRLETALNFARKDVGGRNKSGHGAAALAHRADSTPQRLPRRLSAGLAPFGAVDLRYSCVTDAKIAMITCYTVRAIPSKNPKLSGNPKLISGNPKLSRKYWAEILG